MMDVFPSVQTCLTWAQSLIKTRNCSHSKNLVFCFLIGGFKKFNSIYVVSIYDSLFTMQLVYDLLFTMQFIKLCVAYCLQHSV